MRIREIISETTVGIVHVGEITISIDDHALSRARTRGIDPRAVDYSLRRLQKVVKKLQKIEPGRQFWVYDWSRELSLGLRRTSEHKLNFTLKTLWPGYPSKTPNVSKIIKS